MTTTQEQLNFFATLFPKQVYKTFAETDAEREQRVNETIKDFTFDEIVIARTHPWKIIHYSEQGGIDRIKEIAKTRKQIFKCSDKEIWTYDVWTEKWNSESRKYDEYIGKQLAFRLGNEVIALTFTIENLDESDVYFPASAMAYMDSTGKSLPFAIRENFIEKGLGLLEHGNYRISDKLPRRVRGETEEEYRNRNFCFCSLKTTLPQIINHLKSDSGDVGGGYA